MQQEGIKTLRTGRDDGKEKPGRKKKWVLFALQMRNQKAAPLLWSTKSNDQEPARKNAALNFFLSSNGKKC